MKANLTNSRQSDNISKARKENHFYKEVAAIDPKTGRAVVTARFYWPATVCYSCVWVHGDTLHPLGAGKAGGGGYCKESAAFSSACDDAGIVLSESVSGVGEGAVRDAVAAIARAATGKRKFIIHTSHA